VEFVSRSILPDAVVSAVGYRTEPGAVSLHRGSPSPSLTLVFGLDGPIVGGFTPEQALGRDAQSAEVTLGGLHTSPVYIVQPAVQTGMQLAVRPLALRALLGLPARELAEQVVSATDVLGPEADLLCERLCELPTWEQRFTVLADHLRHRLATAPRHAEPRADVAEAWRWIARHRGTGSISGLARHVHLSPRQLSAVFRAELGLSPKALSRLMRFEHARQRIAGAVRTGAPLDLAGTAHECGYFDHAHLVRDFQQYLGASPSTWVAEERRNIQGGAAQPAEDFPA
jgi:AraC-like DNA-binding protein